MPGAPPCRTRLSPCRRSKGNGVSFQHGAVLQKVKCQHRHDKQFNHLTGESDDGIDDPSDQIQRKGRSSGQALIDGGAHILRHLQGGEPFFGHMAEVFQPGDKFGKVADKLAEFADKRQKNNPEHE